MSGDPQHVNASEGMARNQVVNARERAKRHERRLARAALGVSSAAAETVISPSPAAPSAEAALQKGILALKMMDMKGIKVLHQTQSNLICTRASKLLML